MLRWTNVFRVRSYLQYVKKSHISPTSKISAISPHLRQQMPIVLCIGTRLEIRNKDIEPVEQCTVTDIDNHPGYVVNDRVCPPGLPCTYYHHGAPIRRIDICALGDPHVMNICGEQFDIKTNWAA